MATEFLMPKLGLTMEEGTITEWLVDHDSDVVAGAVVLRIETDKTETDIEASSAGRLQLVGTVGETYACGELIGWFLDEGEAAPGAPTTAATPATHVAVVASTVAPSAATTPARSGQRLFASPHARRLAAERDIDLSTVTGTGPNGRIVAADLDDIETAPPTVARTTPATTTGARPTPATAAARQLAELLGLDLADAPVDPIDRRVTRESVARHVRNLLASDRTPRESTTPSLPQEPSEIVPFTGMRGAIASRMHASLQQMAQLSLFMDADADALVADRTARKEAGSTAPTYTDYVVAAVARALRLHPRVNSQVIDDGIALLPEVHVGLAVALDDGLVVPVIRSTAQRDLTDLAAESSRLADGARGGDLGFADFEGGTFAVTTLGVYGVDGFTPVINPPNAAILGVGRIRDDVVATDDGITTVARLTLSLTWDHRVFDGALAAEFTRSVCDLLQHPADLDRSST